MQIIIHRGRPTTEDWHKIIDMIDGGKNYGGDIPPGITWEKYELLPGPYTCPLCATSIDRDLVGKYGVFNAITDFLEAYNWIVTADIYKKPEESPCIDKKEHTWEGRRIAGIPFRRCFNCGRTQRRLYRPYFENYREDIIPSDAWASSELLKDTTDSTPGTPSKWK